MSYATLAELRAYLRQAPTGTDGDALLQDVLDRATDMIETALGGITFVAYGATATAKDFRVLQVTDELAIPAHEVGSVTVVQTLFSKGTLAEATTAITDYDELDDGRLYREAGWEPGWYRITAKWGYGPAPATVVQVTLEVAANIYRMRQSGMSTEIGAEGGGAVTMQGALTNTLYRTLMAVRAGLVGVVFA